MKKPLVNYIVMLSLILTAIGWTTMAVVSYRLHQGIKTIGQNALQLSVKTTDHEQSQVDDEKTTWVDRQNRIRAVMAKVKTPRGFANGASFDYYYIVSIAPPPSAKTKDVIASAMFLDRGDAVRFVEGFELK